MKIIAYYRSKQKKADARKADFDKQREAVAAYAAKAGASIVAEYTEYDTSKRQFPKLTEACRAAVANSQRLVIARFEDRKRMVEFVETLRNTNVKFVACDFQASEANINDICQSASLARTMASRIAKDSLAVARANGKKLGSARPGHWEGREHLRGSKKGAKNSAQVRSDNAKATYGPMVPKIKSMRKGGFKLQEIADRLNKEGFQTTQGMPLTDVSIHRIIERYINPPEKKKRSTKKA